MHYHTVSLTPGLYIVATPLGNARDISLRALDVLASVDMILCEDTRTSGKLMQIYGLGTRRVAYHEHNAAAMRPKILDWLADGKSLALISDAGTPLISDPGMPLVRAARAAGYDVTAIPGASAPIAALSIAGLPTDRFFFAGFLPPKQAARRRSLDELAGLAATLVFFESARRLPDLLADLQDLWPTRQICVARELTKKFEEVITGSPAHLLAHFADTPARGELVILVEAGQAAVMTDEDIETMLRDALETMSRRDAVQSVTQVSGLPRKDIYARALNMDMTSKPDGPNKKKNSHDPTPDKS